MVLNRSVGRHTLNLRLAYGIETHLWRHPVPEVSIAYMCRYRLNRRKKALRAHPVRILSQFTEGGIRKSLGLNCAVFAYLITAFGEQVQDLTYFFLAQSS